MTIYKPENSFAIFETGYTCFHVDASKIITTCSLDF